MKPTDSPTRSQPNPRKVRLKWHLGHLFPQRIFFRGLGLILGNRLQETQPNQILRKRHIFFVSVCVGTLYSPLETLFHSDVWWRKVESDDVLCSWKKTNGPPTVEFLDSIQPEKKKGTTTSERKSLFMLYYESSELTERFGMAATIALANIVITYEDMELAVHPLSPPWGTRPPFIPTWQTEAMIVNTWRRHGLSLRRFSWLLLLFERSTMGKGVQIRQL